MKVLSEVKIYSLKLLIIFQGIYFFRYGLKSYFVFYFYEDDRVGCLTIENGKQDERKRKDGQIIFLCWKI